MEKTWLIRKKSGRILGPLDKEKVISFIDDKSINEEDELCSGNGHWFYIKEKTLLNEHIYSDIVQGFNPVNEAEVVLANQSSKQEKKKESKSSKSSSSDDEHHLPDDKDLEYPDKEGSR